MSSESKLSGKGSTSKVMVLGGGVAGIHAALDLATAGYGVYLIEKDEELGGLMPKLHRIYPLCTCCKLKARIADCLHHPLIEVITGARLESFAGSVGEFQATITVDGSQRQVEVGAVVLAAGLETFDPSVYDTYAYSSLPNVITSVEFEALQKPTGPGGGVLRRPSDQQPPKRIAWLQCVGSREINACDAVYCSSVCCMYALKEAVHTKESSPETETTIFFMDLRAHGKGYEEYFNRARDMGVRLVRSRVHSIEPEPGSDDLRLAYADESSQVASEVYDLVVLSVGLRPAADSVLLAEKLGIQLTPEHFVHTEPLAPVQTSVPGIFVCGALKGPQEINLSVVQASAAAAAAAAVLEAPAQESAAPPVVSSPATTVQVGVAFHLCPSAERKIGPLVAELEKYAQSLQGVTAVTTLAGANGNTAAAVAEFINNTGVNRLVFASCTPSVHRQQLERGLLHCGLSRYLYDLVDLRTLGGSDGELARLQQLLAAAVARAKLLEPLQEEAVPVTKAALVVGGGIAGMEAALAIADHGFAVTLVERGQALGGHGAAVRSTWDGREIRPYLQQLIDRVHAHEKITVYTRAAVLHTKGFAGHFQSLVQVNGGKQEVAHGVTVLAVGGKTIEPDEYLFGRHPAVYRWVDLNDKLHTDPEAIERAACGVFIQCVGSRQPDRPHCSRICCAYTVRTALDLKTKNPEMEIYVLYREMRTHGMTEKIYKEAREKGVIFIRYSLDDKPQVLQRPDGGLEVQVTDHVLMRPLTIRPDFISLQTAIVSQATTALAEQFKVSLGDDGFFAESPAKLKPVDAETEGVFLAGLALGPKGVEEAIAEAWAVAGRAMGILSRDAVLVGGMKAKVDPDKCAVCCTCVRTCPFHIPFIDSDQGAASIDPGLCQGCGMCVSECPGKAISMDGYTDTQVLAQIDTLVG